MKKNPALSKKEIVCVLLENGTKKVLKQQATKMSKVAKRPVKVSELIRRMISEWLSRI